MQESHPHRSSHQAPAPGLSLDDIYYTLFRHKWKILLVWAVGFVAAIGLFIVRPPVYTSQAKLLVRYVMDPKQPPQTGADPQLKQTDTRGETIINAELEILTSLDLALKVADLVGPEKVLAAFGGGSNRNAAAGVICGGIDTDVPRKGNVIVVIFSHPDRAVVQPVLSHLLDLYLRRHLEVHGNVGMDDFLTRQADEVRSRLTQIEESLKKLRTEAQVVSVEDSKKSYVALLAKIQEDLRMAETELAERKSVVDELQKWTGTNVTNGASSDGAVSGEVADRYKALLVEVNLLQRRRHELMVEATEEHPTAKRLKEQIDIVLAEKRKLEIENPGIVALNLAPAGTNDIGGDLSTEMIRVNGLMARIEALRGQLAQTRSDVSRVVEVEPIFTELERKRDFENVKLRYLSSSLDQAKDGESFGSGKVTGISTVQSPSPPVRDSKKLLKPLGGILAGAILGGLALAFFIDLVLDRTVKRPSEIERRLGLRVFLSVPNWRRNGHASSKPSSKSRALQLAEAEPSGDSSNREIALYGETPPWESHHALSNYFEALRDRLITFFEIKNMTHNPKLVGVTSCSAGAGVTTLAAGLAASLSETGEGNVLLVDMNTEDGAVYPFKGGKPNCGLSELLQSEKPGTALVHHKLYRASVHETKADELPTVLPKRFANLVPKMKASDFDYIIFDFPPVTETSMTPRLSRFMDTLLMVVESEKTSQDALKRAYSLLKDSGVSASTVLNKGRTYVPKVLSQQL